MAALAQTIKFNMYIVHKRNISMLTLHPGKMVLEKTIILFTCIAKGYLCLYVHNETIMLLVKDFRCKHLSHVFALIASWCPTED